MRRTLLMIAAVALLLTQCRKPAVELPTAGPANENMVSMTVTVGHGGKTDINGTTGAIKWSAGDKLYVGAGEEYIGCLELQSGADSPTGTFSGTVTADPGIYTFGFYYLGRNTPAGLTAGSTSVDISFAEQDGRIGNLSDCHIGYGTATGRVDGTSVILESTDPVTMTSKVAIAYFEFKDGETPYKDGIMLSGEHICSSMTVGFGGTFTGKTGTEGKVISLTDNTSSKKYVMLVPPATVGEETLNFGGGATGTTKFYQGIEANKFYCVGAGKPIEVKVKPLEFTVDDFGTTVEFSPGNLYWDGTDSKWKFEENQWDYRNYSGKTNDAAVIGGVSQTTPSGTVGSFFWSKTASVAYAGSYSDGGASTDDVFFTEASGFQVSGETANAWRTLSKAEWYYLFKTRTNAKKLRARVTLKITETESVSGLVILPGGSTVDPSSVTTPALVASSGAVFLPLLGERDNTKVDRPGDKCAYWASTSEAAVSAGCIYCFSVTLIECSDYSRKYGNGVRLVR